MDLTGYHITPTVRLVRELRTGARGSIWLAENIALDAPLSVQTLNPKLSQDIEAVELFLWGARIAAQEKSPRAVQFFGSGVTGEGIPYLLQEMLPGEDLAARIQRAGRLSLEQTVQLVHQLAMEIQAAHAAKVVHRGVRPEGIFVQDEGRGELFVKVLGFDITAQFDRRAGLPEAAMSPARYMSPELLLSPEDVDGRADLWSLAAVAYHCLTGRAPFAGRSIAELLVAIDRAMFTPASKLVSDLPPQVDDFFAHALRRDIDARFQRAEELDEELARCRREDPSKIKVPTPVWQAPVAVQAGAAQRAARISADVLQPLDPDAPSRIPVRRRGETPRDASLPHWPPPSKTDAPVALSPARARARYVPEAPLEDDDFELDHLRRRDARHRGALGFVSAVLLAAGLIASGALFMKRRSTVAGSGDAASMTSHGGSAEEDEQVAPSLSEPSPQATSAQAEPTATSEAQAAASQTTSAPQASASASAASALVPPAVSAASSSSAHPAPARKRPVWRTIRPAPAVTPAPAPSSTNDVDENEDVYPTEPPTKQEKSFDPLSAPISTAIPAAPRPSGAELVQPVSEPTMTPLLPVPSTANLPPARLERSAIRWSVRPVQAERRPLRYGLLEPSEYPEARTIWVSDAPEYPEARTIWVSDAPEYLEARTIWVG